MARRPRIDLFENNVVECYHYEIQILADFREVIEELLADLLDQESHVRNVKQTVYGGGGEKNHSHLQTFFDALKQPPSSSASSSSTSTASPPTNEYCWYMSGLAKLVLNIESQRKSFAQLIPSSSSETMMRACEVLQCESRYLSQLLASTKRIIYDAAENFSADSQDFRFLEKDDVLDEPECFDTVCSKILNHTEERLSKAEKDKLSFDAFSILEFIKIRKKFSHFLFGLANLLDIYKLQVARIGEEFQKKFDSSIDMSTASGGVNSSTYSGRLSLSNTLSSAASPPLKSINYLKLLLDVESVKIAKDILVLENWVVLIIKPTALVHLTQYLESLILCSQLTQNYVIANNIYAQSILNDLPKSEFMLKLRQSAGEHFKNVFEKKKAVAVETAASTRNAEINRETKRSSVGGSNTGTGATATPVSSANDEGRDPVSGKIHAIATFCKRLKREV